MTGGRKPNPPSVRKAGMSEDTKARMRAMYADLERRAEKARAAIERDGAMLEDFRGRKYLHPQCAELNSLCREMRALARMGIFDEDECGCLGSPGDDAISDLID